LPPSTRPGRSSSAGWLPNRFRYGRWGCSVARSAPVMRSHSLMVRSAARGCHHAAAGREGHVPNRVLVSTQGKQFLPSRSVPDLHGCPVTLGRIRSQYPKPFCSPTPRRGGVRNPVTASVLRIEGEDEFRAASNHKKGASHVLRSPYAADVPQAPAAESQCESSIRGLGRSCRAFCSADYLYHPEPRGRCR
jgi:hypothetical protein